MKKLTSLLLVLLLLTSSSFAEDIAGKLIKVNLIVFSHINSDTYNSENWPRLLLQNNFPDAEQFITAKDAESNNTLANANNSFLTQPVLIPADHIGLPATIKRLKREGNHIVLNIAWVQSAVETNHWIHIYGGQAYNNKGQALENAPNVNTVEPIDNAQYWELNGRIQISYNRFFNIGLRLYLTIPQAMGDIDAEKYNLIPLYSYPLISFHRSKPDQMTYFDHPLFSALVLISPYKT